MNCITRRSILGGVAAMAVPAAALSQSAVIESQPDNIGVDDFLSKAPSSERARYHANALAEVMGQLHPERSWRCHIEPEHGFALIIGDERPSVKLVREG